MRTFIYGMTLNIRNTHSPFSPNICTEFAVDQLSYLL